MFEIQTRYPTHQSFRCWPPRMYKLHKGGQAPTPAADRGLPQTRCICASRPIFHAACDPTISIDMTRPANPFQQPLMNTPNKINGDELCRFTQEWLRVIGILMDSLPPTPPPTHTHIRYSDRRNAHTRIGWQSPLTDTYLVI
jgi:hypothetical protein